MKPYLYYIAILVLFVCIFALIGCAHEPEIVYIPTRCPAPVIAPEPIYPKLYKNSTAADFVKWCIISNKMCRDDDKALRMQLGGYK